MRLRSGLLKPSNQGDGNERKSASRHEQVDVHRERVRREDFATAVVDVPVYAKSDNVLTDQRSMSVEAVMPEDFNEKVRHALQVFADTLEASFKEESTNVQQKA